MNNCVIRCLVGLFMATVGCHAMAAENAGDIVKPTVEMAINAYHFGYQHQHCSPPKADPATYKMLIMYKNMCEYGVHDRKAGLKPFPQAAGASLAETEGVWAIKEKRPKDAYKWFGIAAHNGRIKAQITLGQFYTEGYDGRKDCAKGVHWITTAAKTGYPEAQYRMGELLSEGICLRQDYAAAERWYTRAAEQKYAEAWTRLAVMMANGLGVARNYGGALLYLKVAEALGDAKAGSMQKQFSFTPEQEKQIDHIFNNLMARIRNAPADHERFTLHVPLTESPSTQPPPRPTSKNAPAPAAPRAKVDFAQQALDEFAASSGVNLVGVPEAYKKTAGLLRGENHSTADRYAAGYLAWYFHAFQLRKEGAKPPPVVSGTPGTEKHRLQLERLKRMIEMEEWLRKQKGDVVIASYGLMLRKSVFAPISAARRNGRELDFDALLIQAVNTHYHLHATAADIQRDWK